MSSRNIWTDKKLRPTKISAGFVLADKVTLGDLVKPFVRNRFQKSRENRGFLKRALNLNS